MKKYRQLAKEIAPTKSLLTVLTPTQSGNKHLIESIISDPLLARKTDHPAPHIPKTIIKKPIVETISETISEAVLIEVAPPSVPQPPVAFAPVSMPQETPVPVVPVSTDNMNKYLTDKSFQQPNPDPVPQEMDAVTAKLKFLEQAIGRIAAHGPGSGEVNLRYLDDVDRPSIIDGKFLKYNGTTKKFEFADPLLGDIDIAQVNSDWDAVSGVAEILNKPTIPAAGITSITPTALSASVHIAATTVGTVATLITDATTANTANTIVVRDANGDINVNASIVHTTLTAVNYTATVTDYWIGLTAKDKTVTLPATSTTGRQYMVVDCVNSGTNNGDITVSGGGVIVGNITLSVQSQTIICTYVAGTWYCS